MKAYVNKAGQKGFKQSFKTLERAAYGATPAGYCCGCGKKVHGVEPDARKYECPHCGVTRVYGAEELILIGLFHN